MGVGGLCAAVPALRALRRGLPHRLVLATPVELAPLVALAGVADELAPLADLAGPMPTGLAGADLAVSLHGSGPQSWAVLVALGARRSVGYGRDAAPRWDDDEPERERWCRLLRDAMALPADPGDGTTGDPHADRLDPGLLQISTVDVLEAVDAQLADASPWSWAERVR